MIDEWFHPMRGKYSHKMVGRLPNKVQTACGLTLSEYQGEVIPDYVIGVVSEGMCPECVPPVEQEEQEQEEEQESEEMETKGGKPSKGTPKDKRLSENRPAPRKTGTGK